MRRLCITPGTVSAGAIRPAQTRTCVHDGHRLVVRRLAHALARVTAGHARLLRRRPVRRGARQRLTLRIERRRALVQGRPQRKRDGRLAVRPHTQVRA